MSGLVVAGLVEVALGAVLGFPYALTVEGFITLKTDGLSCASHRTAQM